MNGRSQSRLSVLTTNALCVASVTEPTFLCDRMPQSHRKAPREEKPGRLPEVLQKAVQRVFISLERSPNLLLHIALIKPPTDRWPPCKRPFLSRRSSERLAGRVGVRCAAPDVASCSLRGTRSASVAFGSRSAQKKNNKKKKRGHGVRRRHVGDFTRWSDSAGNRLTFARLQRKRSSIWRFWAPDFSLIWDY